MFLLQACMYTNNNAQIKVSMTFKCSLHALLYIVIIQAQEHNKPKLRAVYQDSSKNLSNNRSDLKYRSVLNL